MQEYASMGLDLEIINELKGNLIELTYQTEGAKMAEYSGPIPELEDWAILNFTSYSLVLKLNFSDPLYVSTFGVKDTLEIGFPTPLFFKAKVDEFPLVANYSLLTDVPQQAGSEEDFEEITSMGSSTQSSMLLTLIIPFAFMVFMSVSMNRVWGLYNML
mmetsp:Transcript_2427/g.3710  ORF Transcript_2427/g.3710 Transcript_2427/m.3710 type:complete len:159 (-) Transcript_2427:1666-2142(-)